MRIIFCKLDLCSAAMPRTFLSISFAEVYLTMLSKNLLNKKLFMIGRTAVYHKSTVNLLAQHNAHKLMRKGKFTERQF